MTQYNEYIGKIQLFAIIDLQGRLPWNSGINPPQLAIINPKVDGHYVLWGDQPTNP